MVEFLGQTGIYIKTGDYFPCLNHISHICHLDNIGVIHAHAYIQWDTIIRTSDMWQELQWLSHNYVLNVALIRGKKCFKSLTQKTSVDGQKLGWEHLRIDVAWMVPTFNSGKSNSSPRRENRPKASINKKNTIPKTMIYRILSKRRNRPKTYDAANFQF